nr:MAG: hypothetical protein [Microvirus sp.]
MGGAVRLVPLNHSLTLSLAYYRKGGSSLLKQQKCVITQ